MTAHSLASHSSSKRHPVASMARRAAAGLSAVRKHWRSHDDLHVVNGVVTSLELIQMHDERVGAVMYVVACGQHYTVMLFPHVLRSCSSACVVGEHVAVRGFQDRQHIAAAAITVVASALTVAAAPD